MEIWTSISVYWRAQIVGWGLLSVVALIERQLLYHSLLRAIIVTLFVAPVMVVFSEILRRFYDRTALHRGIDLVSSSIIFASSFIAGLLSTLVVIMIFQLNKWSIPGWTLSVRIAIPFVQNWLIFSGWSLLYLWISAEVSRKNESERAAKAEAEKLKIELQKLRLQLNPHFLFNTLNGVMEQIVENSISAIDMLRNLTVYLRYSLSSIEETIVKVEKEIEAIKSYLSIEEARFGPRLNYKIDVSPEAASHNIVSFLLQPLIENAIKHGNRDFILHLSIEIVESGSILKIEIKNTGTLNILGHHNRHRIPIGLINLRQRLSLHYPDRHHFSLYQSDYDVVIASLVLEGEPCSEF